MWRLLLFVLGVSFATAAGPYIFHGRFSGKCKKNGFYYRDEISFVICSNNNAYVQPCPKGSKNADYEDFYHGKQYHYNQFCDINLFDSEYKTQQTSQSNVRPDSRKAGYDVKPKASKQNKDNVDYDRNKPYHPRPPRSDGFSQAGNNKESSVNSKTHPPINKDPAVNNKKMHAAPQRGSSFQDSGQKHNLKQRRGHRKSRYRYLFRPEYPYSFVDFRHFRPRWSSQNEAVQ